MTRLATGIVVLATALLSLQEVSATTNSGRGHAVSGSPSPSSALPRRHAAAPPSRRPVVASRAHKTRAPTRPPVVGDEDDDEEEEEDEGSSSGSTWLKSMDGSLSNPSSFQRFSRLDSSDDGSDSDSDVSSSRSSSSGSSGSLSATVGSRRKSRIRVDLSDLPSGHVTLPNGATGIDFSYEGGVVEFDVETARPAGPRETWVQSAENWLQHEVDNPEPMDVAVVCIVVVVIGLMLFALARQTTMDDMSERQTRRQSVERSASTRQSDEEEEGDEEQEEDAASVSSSPSEAETETAEDLEAPVVLTAEHEDEEVTEGSV